MTNQGQAQAKFALVVFDARTSVDPENVSSLEKLLRSSDRHALGFAVRVRVASLRETEEGAVNCVALAGLPPLVEDNLIIDRVDSALVRLGERGASFEKPRNLALVGVGGAPRIINDSAAAIRHLLDQVGDGPEPFGKILRIFTPPGIDSSADPIARRNAATKLRAKLALRIADMLADAEGGKKQVGFVEATPTAAAATPMPSVGLLVAIDNLTKMQQTPDPAVVDITADIRRIHARVNPTLQEFLGVYRTLARRIESLSAELNRDPDEATKMEVARFAQYADTIKKTATLLESLMK
jgi:hypothetical protein